MFIVRILQICFSAILAGIVFKILAWYWTYVQRLSKWRRFPGANSWPIIGNSVEFSTPQDILLNGVTYMNKYGLTCRVQLGTKHFLFNADPRLNELVTTSHVLIKKSLAIPFIQKWLGNGLISSENPRWKIHRRLITPTFHFKIVEDFVPIFNRNAKNLVRFLTIERMNKEFDISEDVLLCTLDTICETAMGLSINALKLRNQSEYVQCITYMGQSWMKRAFSYWKQYDFLYKWTSEQAMDLKMRAVMRKITNDVIQVRKTEFLKNKTTRSEHILRRKKRAAFLEYLLTSLEQNGGFMTDEELREEVDTFIFAGHDTVASAISFAIYYLAKHEDIQEKLYQEIKQIYDGKDELAYENLSNFRYLDAVIKETLRLCPSVPIHSRVMTEDLYFDGKIIPKDVHVVIHVYACHRNPRLFENPEEFNPNRFLKKDFEKKILFGYLPFNAGPRNCIGRRYAGTAIKCILSLMLKDLKFTKDPDFVIQPVPQGVLKSANGIRVRIEKR